MLCHLRYTSSGIHTGTFMRARLSQTEKCAFNQLYATNYPRAPLRKTWNVIVDCHDCYCSMNLPKLSAVDARVLKKGHYCILWLNLEHHQHQSPKNKVNTACSREILSTVFIIAGIGKQMSRAPSSKNFCVRPCIRHLHMGHILFVLYDVCVSAHVIAKN